MRIQPTCKENQTAFIKPKHNQNHFKPFENVKSANLIITQTKLQFLQIVVKVYPAVSKSSFRF